METIGFEGWHL